ncbi:uncharacterized protein LOC113360415 [Papaver somniferum]|uniref:uncharacterized protein LOC113360415 n=1 Tax=Papaver somniferum TaxID=3469 RepID=UPI000E6FDCB9|nr:uncharacterized protein LOC113360415 [Papaver somniferum]
MRNDIILSNASFSSSLILPKYAYDFSLSTSNQVVLQEPHIDGPQSHWIPPEKSYIKINIDAEFNPNQGVVGAIAQDHMSIFLGCETITFDETSPLMAESFAYGLGVSMARRLSLSRVIIEGDAKNVTTTVLGDSIPWSIRLVILDICSKAISFENIKFQIIQKM